MYHPSYSGFELPPLQRNEFQMFPPVPPEVTAGEPDPDFQGAQPGPSLA